MNKARLLISFTRNSWKKTARIKESSKKLLTAKNKLSFSDCLDKKTLANEIAKFFMTKVDGIHSEIDSMKIAYKKKPQHRDNTCYSLE